MISPSIAWRILRELGPGWVARRVRVEAELKLGIARRRTPVSDWNYKFANAARNEQESGKQLKSQLLDRKFLFDPSALPKPFCPNEVCKRADRVLAGEWPYFSYSWYRTGFPPDWHWSPLDHTRVDSRTHWTGLNADRIGNSNGRPPYHADIKFIWEPSRFSVVYLLVRAYAATTDERYAEAFWTLIEDWAQKNPPNRGPNWMSGQEVAFRVMAWCFGLYGFLVSKHSTSVRLLRLAEMIGVHGRRIAAFIEYALSQQNNHGISEAVGLFTIGTLFPQLRYADQWTEMGRRLIVSQVRAQVYEDGSYIQHSFTYERLLIDLLTWSLRVGEIAGKPFPSECYESLDRALKFMLHFCDLRTGRMPNYGANDGTLLLPLTNCDYTDFRPSLCAAHFLLYGKTLLPEGPWSELASWLFGNVVPLINRDTQTTEPTVSFRDPRDLRSSGYLRLQGKDSYVMLRAARYKHRPSHADQLHVDLWWRGRNIACDPGSYLYNVPPPWENAFAGTAAHNTITLAGRDQMTRAGRFLWLDWAQAKTVTYSVGTCAKAIEGSHDGYVTIGARYQRSVLCLQEDDAWIVVDDVIGDHSGEIRLHWLFPDVPFHFGTNSELSLSFPEGAIHFSLIADAPLSTSLARAGEIVAGVNHNRDSSVLVRGWRSLYYGSKEPALSLTSTINTNFPVRFVSVFAPEDIQLSQLTPAFVSIQSGRHRTTVALQKLGAQRIFAVDSLSNPQQ